MKIDVEIKWLKDYPDLHIQAGTEDTIAIDEDYICEKSDLINAIKDALFDIYKKVFNKQAFEILDYNDLVNEIF